MKWLPGGESQDIEDRRDESGGGGGFQFGGIHIGIGGAIVLLILSFIFKTNLLNQPIKKAIALSSTATAFSY